MTSPHVSDSEDELGIDSSLPISAQKLQTLLLSKLQRNNSFLPKSSCSANTSLRTTIQDAFNNILYSNQSITAQSEQLSENLANEFRDSATTDVITKTQETRRSTRRRNVSFYQQHIYTIDSVSYTLKIPLADATELVKQKPEIIEMYHRGCLEKYLKNGFQIPEQRASLQKSLDKPQKPADQSNNLYSQDRSDSEDGYTSSSADESSNGESDATQESQDKAIVFRGRVYKDLDAVSRASGLPKSFFSMREGESRQRKPVRKRFSTEQRIGVAKRKKGINLPGKNFGNDIFTTGNYSQDSTDFNLGNHYEGDDVVEIGSNTGFNGSTFVANESDKQSGSDDEAVIVIGEKNKLLAHNDNLLMFQPTVDDQNMFHKVFHSNLSTFDGEAEVADFEIDPMLRSSSRRNRHNHKRVKSSRAQKLGVIRSSSPKPLTRSSLIGKPRKNDGVPSLKRISKPKIPKNHRTSTHLQVRNSAREATGPNEYTHTIPNNNHQELLNKDLNTRKLKQTFFHLTPGPDNLLPRNAGASTLVYEGLSDRFSLLNYSNQRIFGNKTSEDSSAFDEQRKELLENNEFQKSLTFKILNYKGKYQSNTEAKVTLGKTTFLFSRLFGDCSEKLMEFFKLLLDPLTIRQTSKVQLIESVDAVLSFCAGLDNNEIRSLVGIIDNFKVSVQSNIMKKGQVKDIEFFYLSMCTLVYDICFYNFHQNHISGYDFQFKVLETANLYFEFVCHLNGQVLNQKLHEPGLFKYSMEMLSVNSFNPIPSVVNGLLVPDMKFVESLCLFSTIKGPIWDAVLRVLDRHLKSDDLELLKIDIGYIYKFSTRLRWPLNEGVLSLVYEALKQNRFNNFANEKSFPVIFSEMGLNKDTALNVYLNLLLDYSKQSDYKLSSKFLEKIIPVSRNTSMDLVTFCNRSNILLCLALVFEKNFEQRIDELILGYDGNQKVVLQKMLKVIETSVRINERNGFINRVRSLESVLLRCIDTKDYDAIKNFLSCLKFKSLKPKTQKNIVVVLSSFKNESTVLKICEPLLRDYVSRISNKDELESLKQHFGDINPSLAAGLWCCINGKLVSEDQENWSRLIKFNNFDDESFVYSYILRHSGQSIYQIERELFLVSLLKNLVRRKYSSSLNTFLKEVEKVDPKLINSKGVLIQTHRFQLVTDFMLNILQNESSYFIAMLFSSLVRSLESEVRSSIDEGNPHYKSYVKRIIEFLCSKSNDYLKNSNELDQLKKEFDIPYTTEHRKTVSVADRSVNFKYLEQKLLDSVENKECLDGTLFKDNVLKVRNSGTFDISRSSLYDICCFISIHAELLEKVPSCWILLSKLTESLSNLLQRTRNFSQVDIFCLAKTIKLFHFMFKHKYSNFYNYQLSTSINIYRILSTLFDIVEGTNDYFVIYDLSFVFMSTGLIFDNEVPDIDCTFFIKVPKVIPEVIMRASLTVDENLDSEVLQRKLLDEYGSCVNRLKSTTESYEAERHEERRISFGDEETNGIVNWY